MPNPNRRKEKAIPWKAVPVKAPPSLRARLEAHLAELKKQKDKERLSLGALVRRYIIEGLDREAPLPDRYPERPDAGIIIEDKPKP